VTEGQATFLGALLGSCIGLVLTVAALLWMEARIVTKRDRERRRREALEGWERRNLIGHAGARVL